MRNQLLMCSMWEPAERQADRIPCIIYMHGNSSGRVEALAQLSLALSLGCTLFAFDFAGSGQSEGEYVSLGLFEKEDLHCVLEYLRGTAKISTIALWGRSMGAATAIMHGASDATIAGMILDSSFADLQMLAQGMVDKGKEHGYHVPSFVVKLAIRMIRSSVLKEAGFDIKEIAPINYAPQCFSPALFASGINDNFVPPKHR
jgi:pimeloyl-ACP methyl ester carboxylesterase